MTEPTGRNWRGGSSGRGERPEEEPPPVVIRDKRKFDAEGNLRHAAAESDSGPGEAGPSGAGPSGAGAADPLSQDEVDEALQVLELQTQLDERTADLQRLSAEYANYRKRVDRDRVVIGEVASGRVLERMLPILDDIERADAHGDLSGAFKTVADKLVDTLTQLGLEPFGTPGDPFDPAIHEAVLHNEDDTVETPTATTVMRPGYRLGERLLRPAMVGVTDPATTADPQSAGADAESEDQPDAG